MGKGALCLTCHNSRNGAQTGSDTLTFLHEDGEPYNAGNPTSFSAPHQADQGDVFTGHNAYFMGANMPMTSRHAAIQDTCVGCHMTLQPKGYLSHGAPAKSGHLFRIEEADQQTLCANCHGNAVNGEGIQAQVEGQLAALATAMGNAVKTKLNGFAGGLVRVRAWDEATDLYSSTSASNVVLDVVGNPVTSVGIEENHGQIGFVLHFAQPITVPFVDASGAPAREQDHDELRRADGRGQGQPGDPGGDLRAVRQAGPRRLELLPRRRRSEQGSAQPQLRQRGAEHDAAPGSVELKHDSTAALTTWPPPVRGLVMWGAHAGLGRSCPRFVDRLRSMPCANAASSSRSGC